MGAGKSTVGRALALHLQVPFYDLDACIERRTDKTIPDIFTSMGEAEFRRLELEELQSVAHETARIGAVMATGGGIVTTAQCRELLRADWKTIYLSASVETLVSRLKSDVSGRPKLHDHADRLKERLTQLFQQRESLYQEVAHDIVSVDGRDVAEIVEEIVQHYG